MDTVTEYVVAVNARDFVQVLGLTAAIRVGNFPHIRPRRTIYLLGLRPNDRYFLFTKNAKLELEIREGKWNIDVSHNDDAFSFIGGLSPTGPTLRESAIEQLSLYEHTVLDQMVAIALDAWSLEHGA